MQLLFIVDQSLIINQNFQITVYIIIIFNCPPVVLTVTLVIRSCS